MNKEKEIQQIKIDMQKELKAYKASKKNIKLYYDSMRELSSYLNEKEKS